MLYCRWLSEKSNKQYRLPTEAEWMLAAAGSDRAFAGDVRETPLANYGNMFGGPMIVGAFEKTRSDIGCWDMLGNVWEWCSDQPQRGAGLRTLKGGSYSCSRSSLSRGRSRKTLRTCRASDIGFRVLKEA